MTRDGQAITDAFSSYIDSFRTLQATNVLRYCHTPFLFISSRGVRMMADFKELEELIGRLMASLKASDFSRSEITDMRVSQMSDNTAFVSVSRVRYKTDGQVLERLGETYTLQKISDAWKIVIAITHDPDSILTSTRI
jgi:hypothetical protein